MLNLRNSVTSKQTKANNFCLVRDMDRLTESYKFLGKAVAKFKLWKMKELIWEKKISGSPNPIKFRESASIYPIDFLHSVQNI